MASIFGGFFNRENSIAPESPSTGRSNVSKPSVSQAKTNRTFFEKMSMALKGDELDSISFYDRFREEHNKNGDLGVVSEKHNTTLKFTKTQLNEIVKIAKKELVANSYADVSFKYNGDIIDARSKVKNADVHLKMFLKSDNVLAGGGGGQINTSTKISTGSASIEKIGHDKEAFNNEVEVLYDAHTRLEKQSETLRNQYPEAFRKTKSGQYKCILISPKPAFVDLQNHRYQMKRFDGDLVQHFGKIPEGTTPEIQKIALAEKNKLAKDIVASVDILHKLGIVHKDIKMPNFLMDGGRVVLADFGEAMLVRDPLDPNLPDLILLNHTFGTAEYTSVPIMRELEKNVNENEWDSYLYNLTRLDNYAVGVVLYELYAGVGPYETDINKAESFKLGGSKVVAKALQEEFMKNKKYTENTPPELQIFINALLLGYPVDKQQLHAVISKL